MVNSHVCILQKTFNLSTRAKLWAMPRKELCLCQGVVSPKMPSSRNCPRRGDTDTLENLWFTDDPALIILLANRRNWTPAKLDHLLGRSHCCRLLLFSFFFFLIFYIVLVKDENKHYGVCLLFLNQKRSNKLFVDSHAACISILIKGTSHDSIFQISLFPHLLIFLQFTDPYYVLNLSTKAVLQK